MYPVHPEMIHRNNPKHEIFRFDIQSKMATETEFKTLVLTGYKSFKIISILFFFFFLKE